MSRINGLTTHLNLLLIKAIQLVNPKRIWPQTLAPNSNASMSTAIFTYGSLLFTEIMQAVTGKLFLSQSATLRDYARYGVRGANYPGIVPSPGACVEGQLYQDVDQAAVEQLDFFEGDLYRRVSVDVDTDSGIVRAQTYIVPTDKAHHLSRKTWDPDAFRTRDYDTFLKQCKPLFRGRTHRP